MIYSLLLVLRRPDFIALPEGCSAHRRTCIAVDLQVSTYTPDALPACAPLSALRVYRKTCQSFSGKFSAQTKSP